MVRTACTRALALSIFVLVLTASPGNTVAEEELLAEIRSLRLAGELDDAQVLCEQALKNSPAPETVVSLHLELARIHDRFGLHNNTRPVAEALRHIEAAASSVQADDVRSSAQVELAFASYFYRAEMPDREFPTAVMHSQRAIELFTALEDWHGAADAVHRLGLIRMQQGKYDEARDLFDESLDLDIRGGARVFFLGEYERHVGFVDRFAGNIDSAIAHFRRSLEARREAGAIDASLFAAVALASTLIEAGRPEEAAEYLQYATGVGEEIESRYGKTITLLALGYYHRDIGQAREARAAFEGAAEAARSIDSQSIEARALEAMEELAESAES